MAEDSLERFIESVGPKWGPLSTGLVACVRQQLENLLKATVSEGWLAALHRDAPAYAEMHRDRQHGFLLLAHTEHVGLYRPPHDHGRGWVAYAIQRGEIEMGTYARIEDPDGRVRLVKRDANRLRAGQVQVYLPGDIHDTRCIAGPALLFRFTERDLKVEDAQERKVTRYGESGGVWAPGAS